MYSTPPPGAQFSTERRSFAIVVNLSRWRDLNPRPLPYQGSALPTELRQLMSTVYIISHYLKKVKSFLKKYLKKYFAL